MSTFPTDAEREAVVDAIHGGRVILDRGSTAPIIESIQSADRALAALAPLIAARERQAAAEAWDEGAEAAWERSTAEVNASRYHWRSEGEPRNPYRAAEGGGSDE